MTDEEKRKIQLERTSLAAEYGNDFDSIQKYCIEKIIKRNLNIKSTIIGKLSLLISMTHTKTNPKERYFNSERDR